MALNLKRLHESDKRYTQLKKERRIVRVPIDVNEFGHVLLNGTSQYMADGLPKDALFIGVDWGLAQHGFNFYYVHESFDSLEVGIEAPIIHVTVRRTELPKEVSK
jgi:hypothetical protein